MDGFVKDLSESELREWMCRELKFFDYSGAMLLAGALLGSVSVLAYDRGRFLEGLSAGTAAWAALLLFLAAFMAGCGLWVMLGGARAIARLGETYRDRIFVTRGRFGITSTGRVLAQCWMIIGIVWFVFTSTALLGPRHDALSAFLLSYPVLVLAFPTLPVIIGCFIASQLNLHDAILAYKRRETTQLQRMMRELRPADAAGLTKEKQETIEFLQRRLDELENLPDWPFSSKALAGVAGSVFTAVLPILVEGVFSADKVKQILDL